MPITLTIGSLHYDIMVEAEHLPRLVQIATADMCHQTNPRPCTSADFEALFKAAM